MVRGDIEEVQNTMVQKACIWPSASAVEHPYDEKLNKCPTARIHIMLRDLLTQKCVHKKRLLISDTPEHVDLENIKFKIDRRSSLY
jgi:hypothetical protein